MGKHTAAEDATVHPLVADALARRTGAPPAAHAEEGPRSGSTGWPEPAPSGGGAVGWPGEPAGGPQPDAGAEPSGLVQPRRGWRRLFGASPAA